MWIEGGINSEVVRSREREMGMGKNIEIDGKTDMMKTRNGRA